jgi:hypothetical protein
MCSLAGAFIVKQPSAALQLDMNSQCPEKNCMGTADLRSHPAMVLGCWSRGQGTPVDYFWQGYDRGFLFPYYLLCPAISKFSTVSKKVLLHNNIFKFQ